MPRRRRAPARPSGRARPAAARARPRHRGPRRVRRPVFVAHDIAGSGSCPGLGGCSSRYSAEAADQVERAASSFALDLAAGRRHGRDLRRFREQRAQQRREICPALHLADAGLADRQRRCACRSIARGMSLLWAHPPQPPEDAALAPGPRRSRGDADTESSLGRGSPPRLLGATTSPDRGHRREICRESSTRLRDRARSLADVSPAASETVVAASIPRISTTEHHRRHRRCRRPALRDPRDQVKAAASRCSPAHTVPDHREQRGGGPARRL